MNEFNGEAIPPDFEKAKAHRVNTKRHLKKTTVF